MIRSIHIRNFQSHVDSVLDLAPGVNVITGPSDHGKSSIVRAIAWAVLNRPVGGGDLFRHRGAKEGPWVELTMGDGVVCRTKQGQENSYSVNGQKLLAVKTDVPEEVSAVLMMDSVNIQSQHQPYFLVADSPGDVARALNEVCGLGIIDECLKAAGALESRTKNAIEHSKERVRELSDRISSFSGLDEMDEAVSALEQAGKKAEELDRKADTLARLLDQLARIEKEKGEKGRFAKAEGRIKELLEWADRESRLSNTYSMLSGILSQARYLADRKRMLAAALKKAEAGYQDILAKAGKCPVCGAVITKEKTA